MMKKCLAIFLTVLMLCSLAACGGTGNASMGGDDLQPVDEAASAEIRNALSLLVDRNYVVQAIGQGGQIPASSFVPSGMTDADGSQFYENTDYYDVSEDAYEDNFSQAIETLRKYYAYDESTGRFLNFPVLTYLYNNSDTHKAVGEYLQSIFAGVGITLELENQEWSREILPLPEMAGWRITMTRSAFWICGHPIPATMTSSSAEEITPPRRSMTWI